MNFDDTYNHITSMFSHQAKEKKVELEEPKERKAKKKAYKPEPPPATGGIVIGYTSLQNMITERMMHLRHNPEALRDLEESVTLTQEERQAKRDTHAATRNIIKANTMTAGDPLGRTEALGSARAEHFEHVLAVRQTREELVAEAQRRIEERVASKKSRGPSIACRSPAAQRQHRAWELYTALLSRHAAITMLLKKCKREAAEMAHLNANAVAIQSAWRRHAAKGLEERRKTAGMQIAIRVVEFGLWRRVRAKREATALVLDFLQQQGQVAQISTAVQQFRHHVIVIQSAWRRFVVRTHARRFLLEVSFRKIEGDVLVGRMKAEEQAKLDKAFVEAKKKEAALNKSRLGPGIGRAKKLHREKAKISASQVDKQRLQAMDVTRLCHSRMKELRQGGGIGLWTSEEVEEALDG